MRRIGIIIGGGFFTKGNFTKGLECFFQMLLEKIDLEKGGSFGKRRLKLGRASPERVVGSV